MAMASFAAKIAVGVALRTMSLRHASNPEACVKSPGTSSSRIGRSLASCNAAR